MKFFWQGINKNFDKEAKLDNVFENDKWIEKQKQKLESFLRQPLESFKNDYSEYCLPVVVAGLDKKSVSILDFGGGVGEEYFRIKNSIQNKKIKYYLLENKEIIQILREKGFHKKFNLLTNLKKNKKKDIIHFGSSLHYIESWKSTLKNCISYKPKYIIFADLLCGDIAHTFSTNQIYYNKKIPIWIFKENDIINFLKKYDYVVSFKSNFMSEFIKNHKNILPMNNFPKHLRIKYPRQLIFRTRKTKL
jgi:putative methyltransferase (TIGR04325 family)